MLNNTEFVLQKVFNKQVADMLKILFLFCCLIYMEKVIFGLHGVNCPDEACLIKLYNATVLKAEYYDREVGWDWLGCYDCHRFHQGVVVTIDQIVQGNHRWFIHKGDNYGDDINTTITQVSYMDTDYNYIEAVHNKPKNWTLQYEKSLGSCRFSINDFLESAKLEKIDYLSVATDPNCRNSAERMWDLIKHC